MIGFDATRPFRLRLKKRSMKLSNPRLSASSLSSATAALVLRSNYDKKIS
jgi:hypothetical protein